MLESKRGYLFLGFAIVSFLLYQAWQRDYAPEPEVVAATSQTLSQQNTTATSEANLIEVTTDLMKFKIDKSGGDIVYAETLNYDLRLNEKDKKVVLFDYLSNGNRTYKSASVLVEHDATGTAFNSEQLEFSSTANEFELSAAEALSVTLTANKNGVQFSKTYHFTKGSYLVDVDYQIINETAQAKSFDFVASLIRDQSATGVEEKGAFGMSPFLGVAYSPEGEVYEKRNTEDLTDEAIEVTRQGGWIGFIQHYFVSAWIPKQNYTVEIKAFNYQNPLVDDTNRDEIKDNFSQIQYRLRVNAASGQSTKFASSLYVGPKDLAQMDAAAPGLEKTMDLSWVWWIGLPLYKLMKFFFSFLGNWGLAIIMITVVVKTLLYPLSAAQYKSAAGMRRLQPKMQRLKERYGEDKQRMQQEMMKMYKDEGANPFGGCLPMLLQFPIFIALYYVLFEAVELRHAPFFGWINDLSVQDPYFVLPILMGASMFLMQKMQPMSPTMDPMQQKMMQYLPVLFTVFMLFFPAGLVLYWLCNNLISIAQQRYVTNKVEKQFALGKVNKSNKAKKKK